jgi:glycosyltransferase involved in cell wall biosynthesis
MTTRTLVHLPTPIIPPSSTVLTVIDQLTREATAQGVESVVLGEARRLSRIDPMYVSPITVTRRIRVDRWGMLQIGEDHLEGMVAGRRRNTETMYRSSLRTAADIGDGMLFLHDASYAYGGVRPTRERFPANALALYSHIVISRSVGSRELSNLLDRLDAHICVSDYIAGVTRARIKKSSTPTFVVHNGVDTTRFRPAAADEREPLVVWSGRMIPEKGTDLLLRAFARVPKRTECSARLIGQADFYPAVLGADRYERQCLELGAESPHPVEFLGLQPNTAMPDLLRRGRVFCFPTQCDEAFGLGLLEAMASGLACITSSRGGIAELGGDAVVYVDPRDTGAFAEAIEWLLTDDAAAADLGRRARARAEELTVAHQFEQLLDVVRTVAP